MRFSKFVELMQSEALNEFHKAFLESMEEKFNDDCEISMPPNIGRKENIETINAIHGILNV